VDNRCTSCGTLWARHGRYCSPVEMDRVRPPEVAAPATTGALPHCAEPSPIPIRDFLPRETGDGEVKRPTLDVPTGGGVGFVQPGGRDQLQLLLSGPASGGHDDRDADLPSVVHEFERDRSAGRVQGV